MIRKILIPSMILVSAVLVFAVIHLFQPSLAVGANPFAVEEARIVAEEFSKAECSLPASYPESIQQWCALIEKWAAYYGVDAHLIAALILQESGGNAQIISSSGAVGLMQVMPNDGIAAGFYCINGPCFANRPSTIELQDADFNIQNGTAILSGLNARNGNIRDALYRYGPMDVGYSYADTILAIYENYR